MLRVEMDAVTLTVVGDDLEAETLCGLLRAHGIECGQRRSDMASAINAYSGGFTMAGPTEVLVHERDLDKARKLLPER
jgi:hypothetical protein